MKEIPRRYWRNLDIPLILAVLGLFLLGLFVIYSASASRLINLNSDPFYYVKRQVIAAVVGLTGLIAILSIDYRVWRRWAKIGYFLSILLLGATLVMGRIAQGSQRWFRLGSFNLQPSEIAKIVIIVVLAHYLEKPGSFQGKKILYPFLLITVPMALIILQPDLGTSIVFVGIVFAMTYVAGGNIRHLGLIALIGIVAATAAILLSYYKVVKIIQPYQLRRLLAFIDPYSDPTDSGWNVIQSMVAIGSGGFLGKGYLNGTQSQLYFLPANHTDFIFSVAAEEFGFVGASLILCTYAFLIWRGIKIALLAKDRFGTLLAVGCVSYFVFHLIINVGMTVGIMPVTGLPLPFLTYGGSTLLTSLMAVGILLNVGLRRQKIMF
ncbi:MAG: rod shape-determining protein RodA [Firmicutes bacterium]|jgi:rod shape determining protein RodA|nr:rod shape-determining protein RodA [Bacillota bacterium]NLL89057.1 rod shape-determining protein RodA [Bacillota bacterium]